MKNSTSYTTLDCTLRDGGYYNNWDFDQDTVNQYLAAMSESGIDIVELGFRFAAKEGFLGASAYTTDAYLSSLNIPNQLSCAVMINGAEFLSDDGHNAELISEKFDQSENSPVDMVRIAVNVKAAADFELLVDQIRGKGYAIGFNLMQVSTVSLDFLEDIVRLISGWDSVDALYFADSLGNMGDTEITQVVNTMRANWNGPLGIHAHNNMGKALDNTLLAKDLGVEYLDCTVTGMGRGAGNAQTEYLMLELQDDDDQKTHGSLMRLAAESFGAMKLKHQWGENLYYRIAAKHSIHPSYVQNMLQHENFSPSDILIAMDHLSREASTSFSNDRLSGAMRSRTDVDIEGTSRLEEITHSKSALLLASGQAGLRHVAAIEQFHRASDLPLFAINTFDSLPESALSGVFMCDPTRITANLDNILNTSARLILPGRMLPARALEALAVDQLIDIGVQIDGTLAAEETKVHIPSLLTMGYAIQGLYAAGVREIFLAGFDGYDVADPLHETVEETLALIRAQYPDLSLVAVTPSSYSIPQRSIHSFLR